jgi:hypothetical protein
MQSFEVYQHAFVRALHRRHHAQFSWARLRRNCSCGRELPCAVRQEALKILEPR